jgi:acyl-CoA synthetase (AMP-forming)/AMP-acid ligase II
MLSAHLNVGCLADLIGVAMRRNRDAIAIEYDGGQRSYGEFWERSLRCANALLALGFKTGDRIAIFAQNCPEYLEVYVGLQLAGLVAVPANYRLSGDELAYLLNDSGSSGLIIGAEFLPLLATQLNKISIAAAQTVVFGRTADHGYAYDSLLAKASDADPPRSILPQNPGAIFYTSGTTGFPKGAMLSHLALLTRFCSWGWRFGITEEEVTLVPGPIFHQSFGSVALISLCVGARVVLRTEFRGEQILDDLEHRGVTWSFLVPKMISTLLESAAGGARIGDCKRLRGIMSSGARLPTPVIAGFEAMFPNKSLSDAYGWTESGWITYCRHEDMMRTDRSLGQASFGCELTILDEEGRRLGPGEIGQIHAANPVPFLGYYNNPDATAAMRTGRWETGGDVGLMDEQGFLHILDRKRDTIISGGENIYPAEIERVLAEHPKIVEVAVVGVPDEKWGESPRACVVLREGEQITEQELVNFCVGRLAKFKYPKSIFTLDALPRNSMGKVLRRDLREQFWNERRET